jgi:hypothetical protein
VFHIREQRGLCRQPAGVHLSSYQPKLSRRPEAGYCRLDFSRS